MGLSATARSAAGSASAPRFRPAIADPTARATFVRTCRSAWCTRHYDGPFQIQRRPGASGCITISRRPSLSGVVRRGWLPTGREAIPLIVDLVPAIGRFRRGGAGLWREVTPSVVAIRRGFRRRRSRIHRIRGSRWRRLHRLRRTRVAVLRLLNGASGAISAATGVRESMPVGLIGSSGLGIFRLRLPRLRGRFRLGWALLRIFRRPVLCHISTSAKTTPTVVH
jgi:hypothetical protein